jgi:serine/threonine-protein kinase
LASLGFIGPYTLLDILGRGSMGIVYHAINSRTKKQVALKTMPIDASLTAEKRKRFYREAHLAKELKHPHIIHTYEIGEASRQMYIAMELLKGEDLKTILNSHRIVPAEQKRKWMTQLLETFSFAHQKGIIHRDIKPSNVWIRENGDIVVMDFGIARPLFSDITRAGIVLGTPDYISPEQILSIRPDQRTDIYLLGILFYELLTGVHPFQGENQAATAHNILNEEPRAPQELNSEISGEINDSILKALQKDMNYRFQSCEEMLMTAGLRPA